MANKKTNSTETTTPRLLTKYREEVVPNLMKQFGYSNVMQAPRLLKVAVNRGIGDALNDKKLLQDAVEEIKLISGQAPTVISARHSISNFKLREGMPVGVRVTLRGIRMFEFFDRFVSVASPRIRDFRGFSDKSFDGRGNYTTGIREQIIFPEIDVDKVSKINGFDISFVTSANTDEEAYALLKEMGFPFRKRESEAVAA